MTDGGDARDRPPAPAARSGGAGIPGWVFAVVPAVVVGLLVTIVAVAARGDSDDDTEQLGGPAAELPAVAQAVTDLLGGSVDGDVPTALGERVGEIGLGLAEIDDEMEFVDRFDRLPPAEAKLLGRTLGAIQRELSPAAVGGPRGGDHRHDDTVFALTLVASAAPVLDPTADADQQVLNVLPQAVGDAADGRAIVAAVVAGDLDRAAELLERVLSDAGAAEVVSGLAGDISDRVGDRNDDVRLREFQDAYNLEVP